ncbi:MAG TPA: 23S rRNA (adenine(2503)-C(2))-methyltransferase RlmN [Gammaproteobacteria bacterium]|nr:23S rRNA (adenine(2503)-C(2))-methyltransferase RlmN [Gammaproteobacteria bacterium]
MPADALAAKATQPSKLSLLGMPAANLVEFFENLDEKPYRARQIMRWLYQRYVTDYAQMSDLSAALRRQLKEITTTELSPVLKHEQSDDGTRKWLLDVGANQAIETVYIPEPDRGTLCISSQAGCALDCAFCATGYQGFNRNLTSAEVLGQVVLAARELAPAKITNVVFMGMGEPLANYRNVLPVVHLLVDDQAFGLSRRRVTISTAGVVPHILKLADDCNVALAVSLHAPTDELRDRLVPINKVHPIAELLDACWKYAEGQASRSITFEYVLLDQVNDSVAEARQLVKLLRNKPAKVNLIPFNAFPESEFRCSPQPRIDAFWQTLRNAGLIATIRRPRGDDIAAACGQLAGKVRDRQRVRLGDRVIGAGS